MSASSRAKLRREEEERVGLVNEEGEGEEGDLNDADGEENA